jgi:capsular exopolysaccharide synthesis family protein
VLVREPESHIAEAFRSLRTSLTIRNREHLQVILFTSAVPGEGKSFCSANAAVAFAQMGVRTLLIDADLRRPRLAKMFGREGRQEGLTAYLEKGTPLRELITGTDLPGLHLLSAGSVAHSPAELLNSDKLAELFREPALQVFDRIVIDTAPINAVSDTLNFVEFADSICLVLRANKTPKRAVVRAYHELVEAGARSVGLLLNRMPQRGGAGGYYHYSTGAYGSEGVYGAGKAKVSA